MPITKTDREFAFDLIMQITPRQVPLERTLGRLLVLLKTGGFASSARYREVTIEKIIEEQILKRTDEFKNFSIDTDLLAKWLKYEFCEWEKNKSTGEEIITGLFPLHLSSVKIRKNQIYRDYNTSEFVFSMLRSYPRIQKDLLDFFCEGLDGEDNYSGENSLDIETRLITMLLKEVSFPKSDQTRQRKFVPPFCKGQERVFINDLQRLLFYKTVIPRRIFINYLITLFGLHFGLYYFKLFSAIPGICKKRKNCQENCDVDPFSEEPFKRCPYHTRFYTDISDNYKSPSANMARKYVANMYQQIQNYIRAHLQLKKMYDFTEECPRLPGIEKADFNNETIGDLLNQFSNPNLKLWAQFRIMNVLKKDNVEDEIPQHIQEAQALTTKPFDSYIEMIYSEPKFFNTQYKRHRESIDTFFMKGTESCLIAGRGPHNKRRFSLGSQLIEVLVQLLVLHIDKDGNFETRGISIIDVINQLKNRYGIMIDEVHPEFDTIDIKKTLRDNLHNFKQRLRQLGFYTDLSDASNSQLVYPRFEVKGKKED